MQGGLQSQANDSAGCCDRVREHRLTVRTPDREHRLGAEARRQSLSRRSPTAPFAQGSLLCCPGHNRPWFCCPAREHRSPPCGGVAPLPYQGGLQSQVNDSAGCCDRVREHRLAVPTRDREHRLGAEARRQSLSRRSPTAPFAQGSLLCCPGHNRPWFCCPAREHRSPPCGGVAPLPYQGGLQSQVNDSAGCCDRVREHRLAVPTRDREHRLGAAARRQSLSRRSPTAPFAQGRSGGRTAILSLVRCPDGRSSLCQITHNHPFLWHPAQIAS